MDDTRFSGSPTAAGETPLPSISPGKNPDSGSGAPRPGRGRGIAFQIAALLLTVVSALAGTGLARWLRAPDVEDRGGGSAGTGPHKLFADWKKPDLVLVLTAQQHGYILPCGCSEPQIGGLERRYNFLQALKAAGWPYVAVDLGNIPQQRGPAGLPNQQGLIKYFYSMTALQKMGYTGVSFGEYEVHLGLTSVLAEFALNNEKPRVVAGNLIDAKDNFPGLTKEWEAGEAGGVKVGVTGIVSPRTATQIKTLTRGDKTLRFEETTRALNRVLIAMEGENVKLPVLLYQGSTSEATACAKAYPQFPAVLCLGEEDQPPARPLEVINRIGGTSRVVSLGHKGKYIGVLGVYKTGNVAQPFTFRYTTVEMTPEFKTPKDKEKGHPIVELMETYTKDLRDKGYLEKYGQVRHSLQVMPAVQGLRNPVPATYVGTAKCAGCHKAAYNIWKDTKHAHAYQTLVDAKRPSNRQYDPECIICHAVGFGYQTGFITDKRTPDLKDVGCEACHGPGSVHAANQYDEEWHKRINPWKYQPKNTRNDAMDKLCQRCHDIDNDVTWIHGAFEKKWPKVKHYKEE